MIESKPKAKLKLIINIKEKILVSFETTGKWIINRQTI